MRAHVYVSGRVQGVFFRHNAQLKARELGLTGWVRNLPDGRVEIVAEGEARQLEELLDWCKKGPPGARVNDLEAKLESATGEFEAFTIML